MLFKVSKFFLCAAVLAVAFVTPTTLFPFIVGKYVWFRSITAIAAIFFFLGLVLHKDHASQYLDRVKKLMYHPIVIAVTAFTAIFLLAGFFGLDPSFSFWSNFERGEGGLQILMFYVFFALLVVLLKDRADWERIFKWIFIASLFMVFYGVAAGLKYFDADWVTLPAGGQQLSGQGGPWFQTFKDFVGPAFNEVNYRFQGSFGNAAYVAAYLLFALFYTLYILATKYRGHLRSVGGVLHLFLAAVFFAFFWLAATRGAFLGLLAGLFVLLGYLAYTKKHLRKWLLGAGVALASVVIFFVLFRSSPFVQKIPGARIFDLSFSTDTFATRRIIWNIAWDGFKERPFLGAGPENFLHTFYKHFDTRYFVPKNGFGAWFDRAHSVVFDALAETGILGLLSYLTMFISFYWLVIRAAIKKPAGGEEGKTPWQSESPLARAILLAIPTSYLVQGIILFDVLVIYINLFFLFAFFTYEFFPLNESASKRNEK